MGRGGTGGSSHSSSGRSSSSHSSSGHRSGGSRSSHSGSGRSSHHSSGSSSSERHHSHHSGRSSRPFEKQSKKEQVRTMIECFIGVLIAAALCIFYGILCAKGFSILFGGFLCLLGIGIIPLAIYDLRKHLRIHKQMYGNQRGSDDNKPLL